MAMRLFDCMRLAILPVLLLVAVALLPSRSNAATETIEELANYTGTDRQAVLEAGARREGQLLIYAIGTQADPLYQAFGRKYPFIRVAAYRADSTYVARRMMEEYGAGRYLADTIDLSTGALRQMLEANLLRPFTSPELPKIRKGAIEPGGHWVIDYESYLSLGYNTDLVTDADAPKTLNDLLLPAWQGKMAVPGTSTLANWVGALVLDKGEEFVRRLGQQKIRIFQVSARAVANFVVSGEVALSPALFNSHVANSRAHGAHIAWRPLGGVYSTTGAVALASKAPHPHAAMLFIDFLLSKEGQALYQELGYDSPRADMSTSATVPQKLYLSNRPNYIGEFQEWVTLYQDVFVRRRM
jgi:iron(III) transport system substrate-binding protein